MRVALPLNFCVGLYTIQRQGLKHHALSASATYTMVQVAAPRCICTSLQNLQCPRHKCTQFVYQMLKANSLCCHSNATRAPIANPPNSAQLEGSLYHAPKLHPGPCSSVGVRPRTDTHTLTQTDTQTRVTTIHFCVVYDSRKM